MTPVSSYIQVNELSDASVKQDLSIEVNSFRSLKKKVSKKSKGSRKDTKPPHRNNSPTPSQSAFTISSINSPKIKDMLPMESPSQSPVQSQETAPPQIQQPPVVSPTDEKPPTPHIIITNEKSLTAQGYSDLKNTALVDMRTVINETTEKGKEEIE